ncbi:MAG: hypothetical protein KTR18_11910 [Acidiferrobacterales bacterium]|nr:hypothetical protein [Acidiferrobacterales bacterium]
MKERTKEQPLELKGVRLSFKSIVAISAMVGFCGMILMAPILFIFSGNPRAALMLVLLGPLVGALNGAMTGAIGYPIYSLVANRYFAHGIVGFVQKRDQV